MKRDDKTAIYLLARYLIIILSSLGSLYIFYLIFTPITIYPIYFILKIFSNPTISNNTIILGDNSFELIGACISGAAFFILFMLNLATPNINIKTRIKAILFSFVIFIALNISRILLLIFISINIPALFVLTHKLFWYALSTVFVLVIWIAETRLFKIKSIPFYSDLVFLYKKSNFRRK